MTRGRVWSCLAALAVLAGCGSPELWARYRAEREFWHARRLVERIQVNPRLAQARDFDRAIAAFRGVVDHFPLAEWATPDRLRDRRAREVAGIAGDALIAVGRLEESRGQVARALEIFRQADEQLRTLPAARLKALLAVARALEHSHDRAGATAVYVEIARDFPPVDLESGEPIRPALDAPLRIAADLEAAGLAAAADSVRSDAEARFGAEAERRAGGVAAPELWLRVARIRAASPGRLDAALGALRAALAEPAAKKLRPGLVLALAEYCLEGHRPDSALVYAAWAQKEFGSETRAEAMMLEGRIWEVVNPDSAIAVYGRYAEIHRNSGEPALAARFRRAELLEAQGRWEQARAEFRALAASSSVYELAFEAAERIALHHLRAGEKEMGRIEARRAIERFDHLLTTVQDEETLLRIRQVRARLLVAVENWPEACAALEDLWSRYGRLPLGVTAGFRAAEVAERELKDRERAQRLLEEIVGRGVNRTDREAARQQLERLRRERG